MEQQHRDIIKYNLTYLTKELIVDEEFISNFQTNDILSENNAEEVLSKPTRKAKAHDFLMLLQRKGPRAFGVFIETLKSSKDQCHIADYLSKPGSHLPPCGVPSNTSNGPVTDAVPQPVGASASYYVDKLTEGGFLDVNVIPVDTNSPLFISQYQDPGSFPLKHLKRGRAIIISIQDFYSEKLLGKNLPAREGSEMDVVNLDKLFKELGFEVKVHINLMGQEMKQMLKEESQRETHKEADAFILCIMTHGAQGVVYGSDGDKVDIDMDICTPFDGYNCPSLQDKPKIFIIQACQGDRKTIGAPLPQADSAADGPDNTNITVSQPAEAVSEISKQLEKLEIGDSDNTAPGVHEKADFLLAYSTVPGYRSWRRPDLGSWYIRALVQVFTERAYCEHIEDLLIMVRAVVSEMKTKYEAGDYYRQITRTDSSLRKKFYFFPKLEPKK